MLYHFSKWKWNLVLATTGKSCRTPGPLLNTLRSLKSSEAWTEATQGFGFSFANRNSNTRCPRAAFRLCFWRFIFSHPFCFLLSLSFLHPSFCSYADQHPQCQKTLWEAGESGWTKAQPAYALNIGQCTRSLAGEEVDWNYLFFCFLGESNNVDVFVGFEMSVLLTTAIFIVSPFNVGHYHTDDVWIHCRPSKETPGISGVGKK